MVSTGLARTLAEHRSNAAKEWRAAVEENADSLGKAALDDSLVAITAWLAGDRSRSLHDVVLMPPFGDGETVRPEAIVSLVALRHALQRLVEHDREQVDELNALVTQLGEAIRDGLASNESRLIELSSTDGLTGAMSRRAVLAVLDSEIARSTRHKRPLSVVYFDVDHLKQLNDTDGHAAGDRALKDVADTVRSNIRSSDSLGRIGGDEFLLVLPDTPVTGAEIVADKIIALTMSEGRPVSAGVSGALGHDLDRERLIASADAAMRQVKEARREAS